MQAKGVALALWSAGVLFAGSHVQVSVCNEGDIRPWVIRTAEAETGAVFQAARVTIVWLGCDSFPPPGADARRPLYIVRLRCDLVPKTAGPLSLDAMGKAWVPESGSGDKADAYVRAVEDMAERHQVQAGVLLGYVMAHELGHLLGGPGHSPDGVMRASWGSAEVQALRQRWLRFNPADAQRLRYAAAR